MSNKKTNINPLSPWMRLLYLLRLDPKEIRFIFYYVIFAGIVSLSLPLGIQAIINLLQNGQSSSSWILLVSLVTIGVGFQGLLQLMQVRILENIQKKIFVRASFEFAYRIPQIRTHALLNDYPPELTNRFFDILTIQKSLPKLIIHFPTALLQIFLGLMLLSFYHTFFIFYGIILIIVLSLAFLYTSKSALETSLLESKYKYKVVHWLQEVARSVVCFKLYPKSDLPLYKNDKNTYDYLKARKRHFDIVQIQLIQLIGFKVLITVGLLVIGGVLVLNNQMNIGQFVASEIVVLLVINSVEKLMSGLETLYDSLTSLEKIGQVFDRPLDNPIIGKSHQLWGADEDFKVSLEHIVWNMPGELPLVKDVTLSFTNTDRVWFTGKDNTAKRIILKVLVGYVRPTQGGIYVNDILINDTRLNSYRQGIGIVIPEQKLFEGTIRDNVTLGNKNISDDVILKVFQILQLEKFLKKNDFGLDSVIYGNSILVNTPTSVEKRLIIARAILKRPKILVIKDTFHHINYDLASTIIDYIASKERPWALFVASNDKRWGKYLDKKIIL